MRSSARAIRFQVHHEGTHASAFLGRSAPVVMVCVMPSDAVSLAPEFLDESIWPPALENASAFFDAFDGLTAGQGSLFRVADRWFEGFGAGGPYC